MRRSCAIEVGEGKAQTESTLPICKRRHSSRKGRESANRWRGYIPILQRMLISKRGNRLLLVNNVLWENQWRDSLQKG
jgi:hypothetical protein